MKIAYVCADLGIALGGHNGASAHIRSLLGAWKQLGHEIIIISPAINAGAEIGFPILPIPAPQIFDDLTFQARERLEKSTDNHAWKKLRVIRALGHLWNNVTLEKTLQNAFSDFRPDFVYERYSPFCVAGVLVAKRLGIPHLLNVNAPLAWEGNKYRKQALQEAAETIEEAAFLSASHIVTTCKELKEDLTTVGVSPEKISIAPMGVDVELFKPEGPNFRDKFEGKFVIGFVGSLKPWHGLENLIEAFRMLSSDSRFHLLIVGDGPLAATLRAFEKELPGRVTLTGNVPHADVPSYVRTMDVAVAPYPMLEKFYFSPLKILEAMSAGLPVIASRIGQIPELIQDGRTGILVPPGEPKALAESVEHLAANKDWGLRLGKNAKEEIRQKHTWMHRAKVILQAAASDIQKNESFSRPLPTSV